MCRDWGYVFGVQGGGVVCVCVLGGGGGEEGARGTQRNENLYVNPCLLYSFSRIKMA